MLQSDPASSAVAAAVREAKSSVSIQTENQKHDESGHGKLGGGADKSAAGSSSSSPGK